MRRISILLAIAMPLTAQANADNAVVTPAQPAMAPTAPAQMTTLPPAMRTVTLDAGYTIAVSPADELTSKKTKVGDKFRLVTATDVTKDGLVLIPHGTPGEGTVSLVKGTGAFGRSGKLQVSFTSLNLGGRTIMLNGQYEQDGNGNNGAMIGAALGAGLIGAVLVTGHTAVIKPGQSMQARTIETQSFTVPANPAPAPMPATAPAGAPPAQ